MISLVHLETTVSQHCLLSPWTDSLRWRRCCRNVYRWKKQWVSMARSIRKLLHTGELHETWQGCRRSPRREWIKHKGYYHRGLIHRGHTEENQLINDPLKISHIPSYRSRPQGKTMEKSRQWGIYSSSMRKSPTFLVSGSKTKEIAICICLCICIHVYMFIYIYRYVF